MKFRIIAAIAALSATCMPLSADQAQVSWLFVLTGESADLGTSEATFVEADGSVFGFTDRPNRQHTDMSLSTFAGLWRDDGPFHGDHPNAVFTFAFEGEISEMEVVINSVTLDGDRVLMSFDTLSGSAPGGVGDFSLFVDGADTATMLVYSSTFVPFDSSF
ncbi:hypothetical protein [Aquibium sp. ELW1220]|uniref:hypothetical protein n=1 Tax=Aquibium sp. ELW1220 TaxID=2976766 RepID=UPI0025AF041B|nr:hypothetical protein [Aquibium sp. ELW1220]MDN2584276.1 hypothetical protein [Aquibium sp. ELW1220]